jgi:nitrogenase iron protein NifH
MMKRDLRIGIYGKGGIGKSVVAANLSAAFSKRGLKVLQIGCDPKSDSTRNVVGRRIPTVLGVLRERGYLGLFKEEWDVTIYDVLGDVVCGGFAVPIREGYARTIYIVTSGEFMPLYAANNICKGIARFGERGGARLGGIIHNARGAKDDAGIVYEFADSVGGTVIGDIPRSDLILKAETEMKTVIEAYPESDIATRFMDLARRILENKDGVIPRMLSDEEIEEMGKKIAMSGIKA